MSPGDVLACWQTMPAQSSRQAHELHGASAAGAVSVPFPRLCKPAESTRLAGHDEPTPPATHQKATHGARAAAEHDPRNFHQLCRIGKPTKETRNPPGRDKTLTDRYSQAKRANCLELPIQLTEARHAVEIAGPRARSAAATVGSPSQREIHNRGVKSTPRIRGTHHVSRSPAAGQRPPLCYLPSEQAKRPTTQ
jgi:hypothetical protein